MYFDSHAHYQAKQFQGEAHEILANLPKNGVDLVMNVAYDQASTLESLAFAQAFDHVFATMGFHPGEVKGLDLQESLDFLRGIHPHQKVKAVGEIGLDYYWEDNAPKEVQHQFFHGQMELAQELLLPVIIHDRDAHGDSLAVVESHPKVRGVFHCYAGSVEMAKKLVDLGYYISFTGVITYKNARKSLAVIDALPLSALMIETDCPYLSPVPNRGKRNDSRNLPYTAQVIADRKGVSLDEVANVTKENGLNCYQIEI